MNVQSNNVTLPAIRHTEKSRKRNLWLTVGLIVLLVGATPLVVLHLSGLEGQQTSFGVVSSILALVPLAFVVWALHAIDKWEPEPLLIKLAALLWGGVGSILVTFAIAIPVTRFLVAAGILTTEGQLELYSGVIQAPIVEEFAKALVVLFVFLFMRKQFDGPIDGMVIAGLSAAGFAYTENIQYFSNAYIEAGDATIIFVMRGIMSPLTHALFTSLGFGLMLGLVAHKSRMWALLMFPVGWIISTFLHALWNGSSMLLGGAFFISYILIQVPIAIGAALLVVLLRRSEAKLTRERLLEYSQAGWLSAEEVHRLSSGEGRNQLIAWAKKAGVASLMRQYIYAATRLAFNRQRAITGRSFREHQGQEADSIARFTELRQSLLKSVSGNEQMGLPGGQLGSVQSPAHFGDEYFAGASGHYPHRHPEQQA